jgi:hypothetical protein
MCLAREEIHLRVDGGTRLDAGTWDTGNALRMSRVMTCGYGEQITFHISVTDVPTPPFHEYDAERWFVVSFVSVTTSCSWGVGPWPSWKNQTEARWSPGSQLTSVTHSNRAMTRDGLIKRRCV